MIKTTKLQVFCILCILAFVTNKVIAQSNTNVQGIELIKDNTFEFGLALKPPLPEDMKTRGIVDKLYFTPSKSAPKWNLIQQFSTQSLEGVQLKRDNDGSCYFTNTAKKIALYPDKSLLLEMNGSIEYSQPRKQGEDIKKLILEQVVNVKQTFSTAKKILFSMELNLVKCENKMTNGSYIPMQHNAQSPLTIKLNESKTNTIIIIVIPSFNNNEQVLSTNSKYTWNKEKQTIVCKVSPADIWGDISFNDNKWHKAEIDILPILIKSLEQIKINDLQNTSSIENLAINYMSFGWEVSGTFDVSLRVKGLSIKVIN